jgi:hypothetical protein
MRFTRLLGGAAAAAVLTVPLSAGFVAAEEVADGRGTATATTSVLNLALGDNGSILDLGLLVDEATATIDDAVEGAPFAATRLTPVQLSLLGTDFDNLPTVETRTSGAEDAKSTDAVNLGAVGLPAVLSGTVAPASLTSVVDDAGARAGISSSVTDLTAAGGLVSIGGVSGQLGASAADSVSDGTRGVEVGAITLLDLSALLQGIGLPLQDLPLDVILGLLGQLGLEVGDLDAVEIGAIVDIIDATLDAILDTGLALTTPITDEVCAAIDDVLGDTIDSIVDQLPVDSVTDVVDGVVGDGGNLIGDTIGGLGVGASAASAGGSTAALSLNCAELVDGTLTTLRDLVDDLRGTLRDLLADTLRLLDGAALLSADGIKVGVLSSAADTVENSAAGVTAEIGSLNVGGLSVGGVDLGQTVNQVTGVVNELNATLGGVLGTIDSRLATLVDVSVFEELAGTGVSEADGYVKAFAGLSALTVKVTPPSPEVLTAIIGDVLGTLDAPDILGIAALDLGGVSVGDLLGNDLPLVGSLVPQLATLLDVDLLLANPLTLQVASMSTGSDHTFSTRSGQPGTGTTPTGAPGGELPRTGGMGVLPAFVALAIGGAGLGLRRWLQSSTGDIS